MSASLPRRWRFTLRSASATFAPVFTARSTPCARSQPSSSWCWHRLWQRHPSDCWRNSFSTLRLPLPCFQESTTYSIPAGAYATRTISCRPRNGGQDSIAGCQASERREAWGEPFLQSHHRLRLGLCFLGIDLSRDRCDLGGRNSAVCDVCRALHDCRVADARGVCALRPQGAHLAFRSRPFSSCRHIAAGWWQRGSSLGRAVCPHRIRCAHHCCHAHLVPRARDICLSW